MKSNLIQNTLKKLKSTKTPITREFFIAYDPSRKNLNEAVWCKVADQFADYQEKVDFIRNSMARGQFISLTVLISRTGRPDLDRLNTEISYVGMYAIHRAKVLEENLWTIVGIGEIIDTTDEALVRHQFSAAEVIKNRQSPLEHKVEKAEIEQLLKA